MRAWTEETTLSCLGQSGPSGYSDRKKPRYQSLWPEWAVPRNTHNSVYFGNHRSPCMAGSKSARFQILAVDAVHALRRCLKSASDQHRRCASDSFVARARTI